MTINIIGVFLPAGYLGGSFTGAKNIAKMLQLGSQHCNESIKVIFSCVSNCYDVDKDFSDLKELGIEVHETTWKIITKKEARKLTQLPKNNISLIHPYYSYPTSFSYDFKRCDHWLIISDRLNKPLAPVKPYNVVIYDYIQRYIPEIFPSGFEDINYLEVARQAKFVLTTTPTTREDAIQYAGIPAKRVHVMPMEFNPLISDSQQIRENIKKTEDYFIWTTNATQHKNHINAIEALHIYYSQLNGQLKVMMTGSQTEAFDINNSLSLDSALANFMQMLKQTAYVKKIRSLLENNSLVANKIHVMGNVTTDAYINLLQSAKFLWHPTIIDNGTYAVIEAAYYNIPSLSSCYPQMQFINQRFNLHLNFCDAQSPEKMAYSLKRMEEEYDILKKDLPNREHLDQFSYTRLATVFWEKYRELL